MINISISFRISSSGSISSGGCISSNISSSSISINSVSMVVLLVLQCFGIGMIVYFLENYLNIRNKQNF